MQAQILDVKGGWVDGLITIFGADQEPMCRTMQLPY